MKTVDIRETLRLLVYVNLLLKIQCFGASCDPSNSELLNGVESRPDPLTTMVASSEKYPQHRAIFGLAFGKVGWSPKTDAKGEWLEADLGSWAYVNKVTVFSNRRDVGIKVGVTLDLRDWTYAQPTRERGNTQIAVFKPAVLAQYIRVTITEPQDDLQLEMMVIGCKRKRGVAEEHRLFGK